MPWVRFDDQFPIHRKVDGLTDAAYRLHTSAIFWCARNLTDGFVSKEDLDGVTARVRTPSRFAAECVRRGVWHDARQPCPSEQCPGPVDSDGWVLHDYWEYQFSKEQVISDRKKNAERQSKYRQSHSNGSSNGVTNGVSNRTPSRPYTDTAPNRPEPFLRARDPSADFQQVKSNTSPAARLPSARPLAEAERLAGLEPGHRPASDEAKAAKADQVRQSLNERRPA